MERARIDRTRRNRIERWEGRVLGVLRILTVGCALIALLGAGVGRAGAASARPPSVLPNAASSLSSGDRVRVLSREPDFVEWVGWFDSVESDSLLLLATAKTESPTAIRYSQIGSISTSVGTRRHLVTGALLGALVGAAIGAIVAASMSDPDPVAIPDLGVAVRVDTRPAYAAFGAMTGLLLGGAIGYSATSDEWRLVATFD